MKPELYFVITENCNLLCRHCYIPAGPGKKHTTINKKNFKKIIGNLPEEGLDLRITGGEVFTIKKTLYNYLEYIKKINKQRNKENKINIGIQTNGFWAINNRKIKKILNELIYFEVEGINVSSEDELHMEQGITNDYFKRLKNIRKEYIGEINISFSGLINEKSIIPIGRAKRNGFKRDYMVFYNDCRKALDNKDLMINSKGDVYNCCVPIFKLGNLINEPLIEIIKKSKENERLKILDEGGIKELAIYDGHDKDIIEKIILKHGSCGLCLGLYGKYYSTNDF